MQIMLGEDLVQLRLPSGHQPFPLTNCMRLWVPFPTLWPAFELVTFSSNCNLYTRRLIWAPTLSGQIWEKTWAKIFWCFWLGFPFWSPKLTNHERYLYFPTRIIYLNTGIGTALVGLLQVMQKRFWSYFICYSVILIKFHRRVTKMLACGIHVESTQRSWMFRMAVMTNWILIGVSSKFYDATGLSNHTAANHPELTKHVKASPQNHVYHGNLKEDILGSVRAGSPSGCPHCQNLPKEQQCIWKLSVYAHKQLNWSTGIIITDAPEGDLIRPKVNFFQTYVRCTNVLSW